MHNYKIIVEYDGTNFVGWQQQENGQSIQATLQEAALKLSGEKVTIFGAGRTDAGVHAYGQVASFTINKKIETDVIRDGLNQHLRPHPISVQKAELVDSEFHARFSAKQRIYKYFIINRLAASTLENERAWHIRNKLDVKLLKEGAKKLVGTHDFSTFRASNCSAKSPIRTINDIIVSKSKNRIKLKFKSKSFLKNQVRSMVGCLKYLGEKKWDLKKFEKVFIKKDRKKVAPPAPACGLYLEKIIY